MSGLTKEQAIKLAASEFWKDMTPRQIAEFQFFEPLLCMPFGVFHKALEETLGRPVFTHELGSAGRERIEKELRGEAPAPTFEEILALIPEEKRLVLVVP